MQIQPIRKGDLIAIVSPAKAIEEEKVLYAKDYLEKLGFRVVLGQHVIGQFHYFSGTEEERISDFQWAINHPEVKVILCARGGYGSVQIIDQLDWTQQLQSPKWIVGFSDITVFHQWMNQHHFPSIHGTVPLNFQETAQKSLDSLIETWTTGQMNYSIPSSDFNLEGEAVGELIGGNLSIIYSLIGTDLQPDYQDKILFIEEVGEALYAIDRMFYSLKKSQILNQISGLIVGGMTEMRDSNPGYGKQIEEIIRAHVASKGIPVCFHFPAGHQKENWALILGQKVKLSVNKQEVVVKTFEL